MSSRSIHAPKSQRFVRNDTGDSYYVEITVREDGPGNRRVLKYEKHIGFSSQSQAIAFGDREGIALQRVAEREFQVPGVYRFIVVKSSSPAFR
jgi:hypothetical protein